MATITGRYGAVQRLLPRRTVYAEYYVENEVDLVRHVPIYGWDGFGYERVDGRVEATSWTHALPSMRWMNHAEIQESGREPDLTLPENANYSNMVSTMQSWTLDVNAATQTYTASNLLGYNAKYAGVKSCSGTIKGIGAFPPIRPGDRFLFMGFVGPENANDKMLINEIKYDNVNGYVYQVAALATGITININYGTFSPITWEVQWQSDYRISGDELWVVGTPKNHRGFYDYTDVPCGEELPSQTYTMEIKFNKDDSEDRMLKACLESAAIRFTTQTNTTANSCSAAAGGWQCSTVGATDVQLTTSVHGSSFGVFSPQADTEEDVWKDGAVDADHIRRRSAKFYPGADRYMRIYLGNYFDTTGNPQKNSCGAWEFNKMYVGGFTGLNVDTSGGSIVSFSTTLEFNASPKTYTDDGEASGCEDGFIRYRLPLASRLSDTDWKSFFDGAKYRTNFLPAGYGSRTTMQNH